ncbi:MAG: AmmeMemoRadiSam system protein A [Clostridiaceae bacterium]|jgi:AmmeMemoRadiSam system protein A|nr:AmmeMemoRadiSam system protein A [Clostridiaceae bacterium]
MGEIKRTFITPHPPIVVHEVGKGEEMGAAATVGALQRFAREVAKIKPSTIVVTSPHAPAFQDFIFINRNSVLSGDFRRFGAVGVKLSYENNLKLAGEITRLANSQGIPCGGLDDSLMVRYRISEELDHGVMVPLYFINKVYDSFKLVHISVAGMPFKDLYRFGGCIARAIENSDESVVFIASGDLSHRLAPDGQYGFNECGPEFDGRLMEYLKGPDREAIMGFDEEFLAEAGECGLRSFIMMFGALDEFEIKSEVYSYEGPFGVGYAVAEFTPVSKIQEETLLDRLDRRDIEEISTIRNAEDPYTALARKSLEMYVLNGTMIDVPEVLPEEMRSGRAGVFVSIRKHGRLRGCIGTIMPTRKNIASEIIHNAISAGIHDRRFDPVTEDELDDLVYSVDVLGEPEAISSMDELDVKRYGVIVRAGRRSGLLLPDLEGVDTPQQQVAIALQKAGIKPDEKYTMERFEVIRHG